MLSLADLCEELNSLVHSRIGKYPVLVPFLAIPQVDSTSPHIKYLGATEASHWLREQGVTKPGVRCSGALLITVEARDPWAAVERAGEVVARLSARVAVGLDRQRLEPSGKAWVAGRDRGFELEQERRRIRVPALQRGKDLYVVGSYAEADALNDALELLAAMETSTPGAALSNGWAAVEGLLVHPGESNHVVAADRMATIVACSFPRAELTWLAHAKLDGNDRLAEDLNGLGSVTRRVALLEQAIRDGADLKFTNPRDEAALGRILKMIATPAQTLGQVRSYVSSAFRRLYNQRNVVMHAGKFQSVAMRATLRTVPPLAAAGLDRIVVAQKTRPRTSALKLAARAELELTLLSGDSARPLGSLLD
jgi:hypothetical protein